MRKLTLFDKALLAVPVLAGIGYLIAYLSDSF
jgi:hypothetical protein